MLYIYLQVLYYYGNLHVTEGAYAGGRGFPLFQLSFLLDFQSTTSHTQLQYFWAIYQMWSFEILITNNYDQRLQLYSNFSYTI